MRQSGLAALVQGILGVLFMVIEIPAVQWQIKHTLGRTPGAVTVATNRRLMEKYGRRSGTGAAEAKDPAQQGGSAGVGSAVGQQGQGLGENKEMGGKSSSDDEGRRGSEVPGSGVQLVRSGTGGIGSAPGIGGAAAPSSGLLSGVEEGGVGSGEQGDEEDTMDSYYDGKSDSNTGSGSGGGYGSLGGGVGATAGSQSDSAGIESHPSMRVSRPVPKRIIDGSMTPLSECFGPAYADTILTVVEYWGCAAVVGALVVIGLVLMSVGVAVVER